MNEKFRSTLTGSDWWKPFLVAYVLFLAVLIPFEYVTLSAKANPDPSAAAGILGFFVLYFLGLTALYSVFGVILFRAFLSHVSLKDKPFAFTGTIGSFLRINFVGLFLSIITIGFYIPRYMKRVADFFVNNVEYDGTKANFLGKTGKMFKYYILGLFLPILALIVGGGVYMANKMLQSGATPVGGNSSLFAGFAANIVILVMILPFTYYTYKWMVHIAWKETRIAWDTRFWPSIGYILGQILLCCVTLCIYFPAASVKIWRYFATRTVLSVENRETGRLSFEGATGAGFKLIWIQVLLCLITLGIYLPWGYAKILAFFINNTGVKTTA